MEAEKLEIVKTMEAEKLEIVKIMEAEKSKLEKAHWKDKEHMKSMEYMCNVRGSLEFIRSQVMFYTHLFVLAIRFLNIKIFFPIHLSVIDSIEE